LKRSQQSGLPITIINRFITQHLYMPIQKRGYLRVP
jgi:hypothetical protein